MTNGFRNTMNESGGMITDNNGSSVIASEYKMVGIDIPPLPVHFDPAKTREELNKPVGDVPTPPHDAAQYPKFDDSSRLATLKAQLEMPEIQNALAGHPKLRESIMALTESEGWKTGTTSKKIFGYHTGDSTYSPQEVAKGSTIHYKKHPNGGTMFMHGGENGVKGVMHHKLDAEPHEFIQGETKPAK